MEAAAVSQPGVLHIEARFPQGTGVLIYDSSQASVQEVVKYVTEKTKYPASVKVDMPLR